MLSHCRTLLHLHLFGFVFPGFWVFFRVILGGFLYIQIMGIGCGNMFEAEIYSGRRRTYGKGVLLAGLAISRSSDSYGVPSVGR